MQAVGLVGARRRRGVRTARREATGNVSADLVHRSFVASAPNRLWVADIIYIPTWQGVLYLTVVRAAWRHRIIGWAMVDHLETVW